MISDRQDRQAHIASVDVVKQAQRVYASVK